MDNLNDLKKIWLSANTDALPDTAEMMHAIHTYRNSKLKKKTGLVLAAVFLTGIMVLTVFFYKSVMLSTRIGEACFIAAGIMLVYTNAKSLRRLYRVKDYTNKEFIAYLEQVKRNRIYYHTRTQVAGLSLVSVSLPLYIYEGVHDHMLWCVIAYTFVLLYLLTVWFFIRPRAYKKQARQLQEEIKKMAFISGQFHADLEQEIIKTK